MEAWSIAGLHENTVIRAEEHAKTYSSTRRHLSAVPSPVRYIKVDERVWETACRLAGYDYKRIEIINETTVLVR